MRELELLKDGNSSSSSVADDHETRETPPIPTHMISVGIRRRKILHRVLPHVRENQKHIYDPVVLSIGPYHHGKPQFLQVEKLKDEVLNIIFGAKDKTLSRVKILERIDEIRSFYGGGLSINDEYYDDERLSEMMLRDACFVLYYMQICLDNDEYSSHSLHRLGAAVESFMFRDFFMLENQIPLWFIKLLITLTFDDRKEEGESLLYSFLSSMNFGDSRLTRVPWLNEEQEPLHLLEAHRTTLVSTLDEELKSRHWNIKLKWGRKKSSKSSSVFETINGPFRSVTDLKKKGIHFKPSSNCLKDIRFSSYSFYGKLQLPVWCVTYNSKIFFSNVIALEMSPETDTDFAVISYIDFMKSLLEKPEDVKELREKGILFSCLANDEEVVKTFKEIETYGSSNEDLFQQVKTRINEHCCSKAKTWMAELFNTYFRTPWTAIALFTSIFLLGLTLSQAFYKSNKG